MNEKSLANTNNKYIKINNNMVINEQCIRWVQKIDECLYICTKPNGCDVFGIFKNTHKLCKKNNYDNYMKLNKYFE